MKRTLLQIELLVKLSLFRSDISIYHVQSRYITIINHWYSIVWLLGSDFKIYTRVK